VTAAAVILPADPFQADRLEGVRDSKQMTAAQRQRWAETLPGLTLAWGIGFASPAEIDQLGILPATRLAACRAVERLALLPDALLLDYLLLPGLDLPQTALVKGDALSLSIAAASILAKAARDAYMLALERRYPGYGFARHKGYGTAAHLQALERLGPCPEHRGSFAPLKSRASSAIIQPISNPQE
jgi:ribonuclease HII